MPWIEVDPQTLKYPFDHEVVAAFVNTNTSAALGLVKRFNRWEVAFSHPARGTQPLVKVERWAGEDANTYTMKREDAINRFDTWVTLTLRED